MCLACYAHHDGTLLHCLGGILDLEYPALRRAVYEKLGLAGGRTKHTVATIGESFVAYNVTESLS